MKKRSPWIYLLFGVYPISLFDLANSKLSGFVQIYILTILTFSLFLGANAFQQLNILSAIIILLFIFIPYLIGAETKENN